MKNIETYGSITYIDIKSILENNYHIYPIDIKEVFGGTSKCYSISTTGEKYFVKIFKENKSPSSLKQEYDTLNSLRGQEFKVPNIIVNDLNEISTMCKNHPIFVENFIEGETCANINLKKSILLESATILGKIHKVLFEKYSSYKDDNFWTDLDIEKELEEIDDTLRKLDTIKYDKNYEILRKSLKSKKRLILKMNELTNLFNNMTYCMTHGDYSKRQLLVDKKKICGVVDFSDCGIYPVAWELIRSYFLSTLSLKEGQEFSYDLFNEYLNSYLREFQIERKDIELMPYLFLYQLVLSKWGYIEYIDNVCSKEEIIDFILWKDKMSDFLNQNKEKIVRKIKF